MFRVGSSILFVSGLSALVPVGISARADTASANLVNQRQESAMIGQSLEQILQSGRKILLVELYGTTTYVFDENHQVAGPMLRVLSSFGFQPVLPEGATMQSDGSLPLPLDRVKTAGADLSF